MMTTKGGRFRRIEPALRPLLPVLISGDATATGLSIFPLTQSGAAVVGLRVRRD
jgi:hypothetical protein